MTQRLHPHDLHDAALVEEARAVQAVEAGEEGLDQWPVFCALVHRRHDVGGGPLCAAAVFTVNTATAPSPPPRAAARPTSRLLVRRPGSADVGVFEAPAE